MTGPAPGTAPPPAPLSLLAARVARAPGVSQVREPRARRILATLDRARVQEALRTLRDDVGCRHLSAITALDTGREIHVVYHVSAPGGFVVSLAAALPREDPRVASVVPVMPAAALYEREAHDLVGVTFEGHPGLARLLLHEGWPEDEHPLRKDWRPRGAQQEGGSSP